jgi:hypothetical protein
VWGHIHVCYLICVVHRQTARCLLLCNCGILKTLFCGRCQFGLRVIYHVLHFQLQIPPVKYLFSLSLWGTRRPNTVSAKWKEMWKLVFVSKHPSNFSDQRTTVFEWCSCLKLLYFRFIILLICKFACITIISLCYRGGDINVLVGRQ